MADGRSAQVWNYEVYNLRKFRNLNIIAIFKGQIQSTIRLPQQNAITDSLNEQTAAIANDLVSDFIIFLKRWSVPNLIY